MSVQESFQSFKDPPNEYTWACSALHSDRLVGLDRAKMIGGPAQLSLIVVRTSSGFEEESALN